MRKVFLRTSLVSFRLRLLYGSSDPLADLCNITPGNESEPNDWKNVLQNLFALLRNEEHTNMNDLAQLMAFTGRLSAHFYGSLINRDSIALLILLYWLMALDRLEVWWAKSRVAVESRAILGHLEHDDDVRVCKLLVAPKIAFGYPSTSDRSAPMPGMDAAVPGYVPLLQLQA